MGVKLRSEVIEEFNLIIILKWIINIKLVKYWILILLVLNSVWGLLNYVLNVCLKRFIYVIIILKKKKKEDKNCVWYN